jgi:hypothetical protein
MLLYTNRTQSPAIVTIKIENADDPDAAVMIGTEEFFEKFGGKVGYYDIVVASGKELHLINNTIATFVAVRSGG